MGCPNESEEKMKAWEVTIVGWSGMRSIVAAPTRGKAINHELKAATDANYEVGWTDFRARRAPEHDAAAEKSEEVECVGWWDELGGCVNSSGVLADE